MTFASSERSTIGIEWELACVDAETRELSPLAAELLRRTEGYDGYPRLTTEFLTNTIELASSAHRRVRDAVADLVSLIDRAQPVARELGVELVCGATHPFSRWDRQQVTPGKDRYQRVLDRSQWWARQMMIWGVHVHVGVDRAEAVIPVMNVLIDHFAHFQALSASSPFWQGDDTGYASNRALIYQLLPIAGLPPRFERYEEFERMVEDLVGCQAIEDSSELRWDVRPSPKLGTVENRIPDGVATIEEVGTMAALTQCLAEETMRRLDAGETVEPLPHWFWRENKWRAARYGLDANIIEDAAGSSRPARSAIAALCQRLAPIAEELDCADELAGAERIMQRGAGYERQRRVATDSTDRGRSVVDSLIEELRAGLA
ncbi:glutamate--cysteine ligase [Ruicaihuangia caeni]|uniref:Putative glutamate--cysteine ligase 2 n=1 Tax=Ruicaihuangia caeni TaxID=3042517 RepID=A0AAW6T6C0_9MICO|nr:glutamate--cysteine ligase [Klugiella sp. YN-L-19]MDI2097703.1 glutamate--cysteine ligase [Klugiella sp. YN-L-19]